MSQRDGRRRTQPVIGGFEDGGRICEPGATLPLEAGKGEEAASHPKPPAGCGPAHALALVP